jgi:hypothetical protein
MLKKEDGGIEVALRGACADPIDVGGLEAEVFACSIAFETAIDDVVFALVTAGESDFE